MSIADALTALSPNLWLKLDEGSGDTAANSGTLSTTGTYSGTLGRGVVGPEAGTLATRLYTGGQIITGGMDVGAIGAGYTVMFWAAMDASGVINTHYPIVSVGDPANRLARGFSIGEIHAGLGSPNYRPQWNTQAGVLTGVVTPNGTFWHHIAATFISGTNGIKSYVDGALQGQQTPSGSIAALTTDPLLIACNEPCIIAHVAFWYGVLTQTQIQTVASQAGTWPYSPPINTSGAPSGGGTVDLTPVLDAIADVKADTSQLITNWTGYLEETLPSLQTLLDHISGQVAGVQGTLNDYIAGPFQDLVDTVQQILENTITEVTDFLGDVRRKAIGAVQPWDDQGNFETPGDVFTLTDCGVLEGPSTSPLLNVYGLQLHAVTVPPKFGQTEGYITTYEERLADFAVIRNSPGSPMYTEHLNLYLADYTWLFNTKQTVNVGYCCGPGVVLEARWVYLMPF